MLAFAVRTQVRAARDRRVLEHLSAGVAAIEAASGMLSAEATPLARRVSLEVDGDEDDQQSIEVSQDVVTVPASLKQRFFDADWVERPGGWIVAIGAAAAEAAAVQLGAAVSLSVGARRGCTVRFEFA